MKIIKIKEFCQRTGLKRERVYRWCKEGRLRSVKERGQIKIFFDEQKWLDQNKMRTRREKELIKLCFGLEKSVKFLQKLISEQMIEDAIMSKKLNLK